MLAPLNPNPISPLATSHGIAIVPPGDYAYLIDDYTIVKAAPIGTPLVADVVGQQVIVDPNNRFSVQAGRGLVSLGTDSGLSATYAGLTRARGLTYYNRQRDIVGTAHAFFLGFFDPTLVATRNGHRLSHLNTLPRMIFYGDGQSQATTLLNYSLLPFGQWLQSVVITLGVGTRHFVYLSGLGVWEQPYAEHASVLASLTAGEHCINAGSTTMDIERSGVRLYKDTADHPFVSDTFGSTVLSFTQGASFTNSQYFTLAIRVPSTIMTSGTLEVAFHYVDVSNFTYLQIIPNTATTLTIRLRTSIGGVDTIRLTASTVVANDYLELFVPRINAGDAGAIWRLTRNRANLGTFTPVGGQANGTTTLIRTNTSNITWTEGYLENWTITDNSIIAYLEAVAAGSAP